MVPHVDYSGCQSLSQHCRHFCLRHLPPAGAGSTDVHTLKGEAGAAADSVPPSHRELPRSASGRKLAQRLHHNDYETLGLDQHSICAFLISMPCRTRRASPPTPPRRCPDVSSSPHPCLQHHPHASRQPLPRRTQRICRDTPAHVYSLRRASCRVLNLSAVWMQLRAQPVLQKTNALLFSRKIPDSLSPSWD